MTTNNSSSTTDHIPSLDNLRVQIGGTHYREMPIQPLDFARANLTLPEFKAHVRATVTKYVWRNKENQIEDLKKAIHYLEILIEELQQHQN